MMNNLRKPLIILFITIPALIILSAYLKVTHSPVAHFAMDITLSLYGIFIVLSLIDIFRTKSLSSTEKWMYAIAVTFLGVVGGALYMLRPQRHAPDNRLSKIGT